MKTTICNAIKNKNLIEIIYKDYPRTVEPHLVGTKTSGNDALSAWQVDGYSESDRQPPWRYYTLSKIESITVLNETFTGTRPEYNPNDTTMAIIHCRL